MKFLPLSLVAAITLNFGHAWAQQNHEINLTVKTRNHVQTADLDQFQEQVDRLFRARHLNSTFSIAQAAEENAALDDQVALAGLVPKHDSLHDPLIGMAVGTPTGLRAYVKSNRKHWGKNSEKVVEGGVSIERKFEVNDSGNIFIRIKMSKGANDLVEVPEDFERALPLVRDDAGFGIALKRVAARLGIQADQVVYFFSPGSSTPIEGRPGSLLVADVLQRHLYPISDGIGGLLRVQENLENAKAITKMANPNAPELLNSQRVLDAFGEVLKDGIKDGEFNIAKISEFQRSSLSAASSGALYGLLLGTAFGLFASCIEVICEDINQKRRLGFDEAIEETQMANFDPAAPPHSPFIRKLIESAESAQAEEAEGVAFNVEVQTR